MTASTSSVGCVFPGFLEWLDLGSVSEKKRGEKARQVSLSFKDLLCSSSRQDLRARPFFDWTTQNIEGDGTWDEPVFSSRTTASVFGDICCCVTFCKSMHFSEPQSSQLDNRVRRGTVTFQIVL